MTVIHACIGEIWCFWIHVCGILTKKSRLYGFVFWLNRFKELIFFDERKTAAAVGSCGVYTKPSTEKV